MATPIQFIPPPTGVVLPIETSEWPILYEDDEEEDMGDSNVHSITDFILFAALRAHLVGLPRYRVFQNMNLYYLTTDPPPKRGWPYVSPDIMVVAPFGPLGEEVPSYRISRDGPAPVLVTEILSERSAQQRDLSEKLQLYALLGIDEYLLVDMTGRFLPSRILLKRLQPDRTWKDFRDDDGGVTSQLGFRLVEESDGLPRMIDVASGTRYIQPDEAQKEVAARHQAEASAEREADARRQAEASAEREADARRLAEERVRKLEEQIARLKSSQPDTQTS